MGEVRPYQGNAESGKLERDADGVIGARPTRPGEVAGRRWTEADGRRRRWPEPVIVHAFTSVPAIPAFTIL